MFIIKPCDPEDKTVTMCTVKGEARKTRMISGRDFAERFFKKMVGAKENTIEYAAPWPVN
jgi:hypothetical protein